MKRGESLNSNKFTADEFLEKHVGKMTEFVAQAKSGQYRLMRGQTVDNMTYSDWCDQFTSWLMRNL